MDIFAHKYKEIIISTMKNQSADIIIIGGGASGLMAACATAGSGKSVILLEKMPRPGRKIMITGKGRCNFTNVKPWNEFCRHIHPKPDFLKPSFYNLDPEKTIELMRSHGMESVVERGDRAFPASHLSSDVVDTLKIAAEKAGVRISCAKEAQAIVHSPKEGFSIQCTDGSSYICSKLIICTGGMSYPQTGSNGDGYRWAKDFGHTVHQLFPSLTAIVPSCYKTGESLSDLKGHIPRSVCLSEAGRELCGNDLKNIRLSIIIDGNTAMEEFGDLQFTDGGIEGPIGFKVSRKCVNAIINGSKVTAVIDMKPAVEATTLTARIMSLWEDICKDRKHRTKTYKERFKVLLSQVLPTSLISGFIRTNPNTDHKTLAKVLKNWKFEIKGYVGYERSVITAGGIACNEINPKTMESKLVDGLYFAGEIMDLDADTGGYNLQIAFSTGFLAGKNASK